MTLLELVNVMKDNVQISTPICDELTNHVLTYYGNYKISNQAVQQTTYRFYAILMNELKRYGFYTIAQEQDIAINLAVNSMTRVWPELWYLWGIANAWTETDGLKMDKMRQTSSPDLTQRTERKEGSDGANGIVEYGIDATKSTATQTGTTTTEAISSQTWKPLENARILQVVSRLVDEIVSRICILYDLQ